MWAHAITAGRLVLAAAFAAVTGFCAGNDRLSWPAAAVLIALAGLEELTDLLDGWVARRTGTASTLGGIFDPLSDSLSRLTIYFSMALAGWVPLALPLVMTGRDIIVAYTRIANALTGGKTSARLSGKCKAVIQGGGIWVILALAVFGEVRWIGFARWAAAGLIMAVTLWSLVDYLRGSSRAIRSLSAPGREGGGGFVCDSF